MSPILGEMHRGIARELPGITLRFPSYMDDLRYRLYDIRRGTIGVEESEKSNDIECLVERARMMVNKVAEECRLSLFLDKTERIILRNKKRYKGRSGMVKKVKWLEMISYEELDFRP